MRYIWWSRSCCRCYQNGCWVCLEIAHGCVARFLQRPRIAVGKLLKRSVACSMMYKAAVVLTLGAQCAQQLAQLAIGCSFRLSQWPRVSNKQLLEMSPRYYSIYEVSVNAVDSLRAGAEFVTCAVGTCMIFPVTHRGLECSEGTCDHAPTSA